jgi:hypothetical protein
VLVDNASIGDVYRWDSMIIRESSAFGLICLFFILVLFSLYFSETLRRLEDEAAKKGTVLGKFVAQELCRDVDFLQQVFTKLQAKGVEFVYFFIQGKETAEKRMCL